MLKGNDPGSTDMFICTRTKVTLTESIENRLRINLENGNTAGLNSMK